MAPVQKFKMETLENAYIASEQLLRSPSHSDVTIICGTRSWKCQRAILCQRCPFFQVALTNSFKEDEEQRIDLSDDDPDAVDYLLLYLYTLTYPVCGLNDVAPCLGPAIRIFSIADKYEVIPLKSAAKEEIILWFAQKASILKNHDSESRTTSVFECVREIWQMTMKGADDIKNVVITEMVKYARYSFCDGDLVTLFAEEPDFMNRYLKELAPKLSG